MKNSVGQNLNKLDHGELPFGWMNYNQQFVHDLENEEHAFRRYISKATTKEERIAALQKFIRHMEGLRPKIKAMGECHLKYYEEYILKGETLQRKKELYQLTGRKPSQTPAKAPSKPAQRPKASTGIKGFLTKKVWKLPMWAVILIVLFLIWSINNLGASDQPAQPQATEAPIVEVKIEPFTLDGANLEEYGKNLNYGFIGYFIPAGQYTVTNKGSAAVQVTIYAEGSTVDNGIEYPNQGQQAPVVLMPNTMAEVNLLEGEYVKLSDSNANTYWEPK